MPGHEGFAFALLPAVAIGRGTRPLQLAVVTLVARPNRRQDNIQLKDYRGQYSNLGIFGQLDPNLN